MVLFSVVFATIHGPCRLFCKPGHSALSVCIIQDTYPNLKDLTVLIVLVLLGVSLGNLGAVHLHRTCRNKSHQPAYSTLCISDSVDPCTLISFPTSLSFSPKNMKVEMVTSMLTLHGSSKTQRRLTIMRQR